MSDGSAGVGTGFVRVPVDELIYIIQTRFQNEYTQVERMVDFIFAQDEAIRVRLVEALLRYWSLPYRNEEAVADNPSFSAEALLSLAARMIELSGTGEDILSCGYFHQGLSAADVAQHLYDQLVTTGERFGLVGRVAALIVALNGHRHVPYIDLDEREFVHGFDPQVAIEKLHNTQRDFIAEALYLLKVKRASPDLLFTWLARRVAECDDHEMRVAMIGFVVGGIADNNFSFEELSPGDSGPRLAVLEISVSDILKGLREFGGGSEGVEPQDSDDSVPESPLGSREFGFGIKPRSDDKAN